MPRHIAIDFDNTMVKGHFNNALSSMGIAPDQDALIKAIVKNVFLAQPDDARAYVENLEENLQKEGIAIPADQIPLMQQYMNEKFIDKGYCGFKNLQNQLVTAFKNAINNDDKISVVSFSNYPAAIQASLEVLADEIGISYDELMRDHVHVEAYFPKLSDEQEANIQAQVQSVEEAQRDDVAHQLRHQLFRTEIGKTQHMANAKQHWGSQGTEFDEQEVLLDDSTDNCRIAAEQGAIAIPVDKSPNAGHQHLSVELGQYLPKNPYYQLRNGQEVFNETRFREALREKIERGPANEFWRPYNEMISTEQAFNANIKLLIHFLENGPPEQIQAIVGESDYDEYLDSLKKIRDNSDEFIEFLKNKKSEYSNSTDPDDFEKLTKEVIEKQGSIVPDFIPAIELHQKFQIDDSRKKDNEASLKQVYEQYRQRHNERQPNVFALSVEAVQRGPRYPMLISEMAKGLRFIQAANDNQSTLDNRVEELVEEAKKVGANGSYSNWNYGSFIREGIDYESHLTDEQVTARKKKLQKEFTDEISKKCKKLDEFKVRQLAIEGSQGTENYFKNNRFGIKIRGIDKVAATVDLQALSDKIKAEKLAYHDLQCEVSIKNKNNGKITVKDAKGNALYTITVTKDKIEIEFTAKPEDLPSGVMIDDVLKHMQEATKMCAQAVAESRTAEQLEQIKVEAAYAEGTKALSVDSSAKASARGTALSQYSTESLAFIKENIQKNKPIDVQDRVSENSDVASSADDSTDASIDDSADPLSQSASDEVEPGEIPVPPIERTDEVEVEATPALGRTATVAPSDPLPPDQGGSATDSDSGGTDPVELSQDTQDNPLTNDEIRRLVRPVAFCDFSENSKATAAEREKTVSHQKLVTKLMNKDLATVNNSMSLLRNFYSGQTDRLDTLLDKIEGLDPENRKIALEQISSAFAAQGAPISPMLSGYISFQKDEVAQSQFSSLYNKQKITNESEARAFFSDLISALKKEDSENSIALNLQANLEGLEGSALINAAQMLARTVDVAYGTKERARKEREERLKGVGKNVAARAARLEQEGPSTPSDQPRRKGNVQVGGALSAGLEAQRKKQAIENDPAVKEKKKEHAELQKKKEQAREDHKNLQSVLTESDEQEELQVAEIKSYQANNTKIDQAESQIKRLLGELKNQGVETAQFAPTTTGAPPPPPPPGMGAPPPPPPPSSTSASSQPKRVVVEVSKKRRSRSAGSASVSPSSSSSGGMMSELMSNLQNRSSRSSGSDSSSPRAEQAAQEELTVETRVAALEKKVKREQEDLDGYLEKIAEKTEYLQESRANRQALEDEYHLIAHRQPDGSNAVLAQQEQTLEQLSERIGVLQSAISELEKARQEALQEGLEEQLNAYFDSLDSSELQAFVNETKDDKSTYLVKLTEFIQDENIRQLLRSNSIQTNTEFVAKLKSLAESKVTAEADLSVKDTAVAPPPPPGPGAPPPPPPPPGPGAPPPPPPPPGPGIQPPLSEKKKKSGTKKTHSRESASSGPSSARKADREAQLFAAIKGKRSKAKDEAGQNRLLSELQLGDESEHANKIKEIFGANGVTTVSVDAFKGLEQDQKDSIVAAYVEYQDDLIAQKNEQAQKRKEAEEKLEREKKQQAFQDSLQRIGIELEFNVTIDEQASAPVLQKVIERDQQAQQVLDDAADVTVQEMAEKARGVIEKQYLPKEEVLNAAATATDTGETALPDAVTATDTGEPALSDTATLTDTGETALPDAATATDTGEPTLPDAVTATDTGETALPDAATATDNLAELEARAIELGADVVDGEINYQNIDKSDKTDLANLLAASLQARRSSGLNESADQSSDELSDEMKIARLKRFIELKTATASSEQDATTSEPPASSQPPPPPPSERPPAPPMPSTPLSAPSTSGGTRPGGHLDELMRVSNDLERRSRVEALATGGAQLEEETLRAPNNSQEVVDRLKEKIIDLSDDDKQAIKDAAEDYDSDFHEISDRDSTVRQLATKFSKTDKQMAAWLIDQKILDQLTTDDIDILLVMEESLKDFEPALQLESDPNQVSKALGAQLISSPENLKQVLDSARAYLTKMADEKIDEYYKFVNANQGEENQATYAEKLGQWVDDRPENRTLKHWLQNSDFVTTAPLDAGRRLQEIVNDILPPVPPRDEETIADTATPTEPAPPVPPLPADATGTGTELGATGTGTELGATGTGTELGATGTGGADPGVTGTGTELGATGTGGADPGATGTGTELGATGTGAEALPPELGRIQLQLSNFIRGGSRGRLQLVINGLSREPEKGNVPALLAEKGIITGVELDWLRSDAARQHGARLLTMMNAALTTSTELSGSTHEPPLPIPTDANFTRDEFARIETYVSGSLTLDKIAALMDMPTSTETECKEFRRACHRELDDPSLQSLLVSRLGDVEQPMTPVQQEVSRNLKRKFIEYHTRLSAGTSLSSGASELDLGTLSDLTFTGTMANDHVGNDITSIQSFVPFDEKDFSDSKRESKLHDKKKRLQQLLDRLPSSGESEDALEAKFVEQQTDIDALLEQTAPLNSDQVEQLNAYGQHLETFLRLKELEKEQKRLATLDDQTKASSRDVEGQKTLNREVRGKKLVGGTYQASEARERMDSRIAVVRNELSSEMGVPVADYISSDDGPPDYTKLLKEARQATDHLRKSLPLVKSHSFEHNTKMRYQGGLRNLRKVSKKYSKLSSLTPIIDQKTYLKLSKESKNMAKKAARSSNRHGPFAGGYESYFRGTMYQYDKNNGAVKVTDPDGGHMIRRYNADTQRAEIQVRSSGDKSIMSTVESNLAFGRLTLKTPLMATKPQRLATAADIDKSDVEFAQRMLAASFLRGMPAQVETDYLKVLASAAQQGKISGDDFRAIQLLANLPDDRRKDLKEALKGAGEFELQDVVDYLVHNKPLPRPDGGAEVRAVKGPAPAA